MSRRAFLRNASLGAAAVGTVAAIGPSALGLPGASASAAPAEPSRDVSAGTRRAPETEVMAHVATDRSGMIQLYAGTRQVTIHDRTLSEALLRALA